MPPNHALQLTAYSLRFAARRSGFRQLLTPGVDMTSDVKSWLPIFLHFLRPLVRRPSEEPEPVIYDG
jgi:hypothetical protein